MIRNTLFLFAILAVSLTIGCNDTNMYEPQQQQDTAQQLYVVNGSLFHTTLKPNQDLTPLDWYTVPWDAENHYSLLDNPYDNEYIHTPYYTDKDKWGFTNVSNPNPRAWVTKLKFCLVIKVCDLQGQDTALRFKYYINGTLCDTQFEWIEGCELHPLEFESPTSAICMLSDINTLTVEVEKAYENGSIEIHSVSVAVDGYIPSKGEPIPHVDF